MFEEAAGQVHSVSRLNRITHRVATLAALLTVGVTATRAEADPVGDFFKRLGRSIAQPQQPKQPKQPARRTPKKVAPANANSPAPSPQPSPSQSPTATATAPPITERRAIPATQSGGTRADLPYAVPVSGRPGFVTSPFAPTRGLVDVREFASGTEVKDPYTGKIFLTP
jgi:hypothetical protein